MVHPLAHAQQPRRVPRLGYLSARARTEPGEEENYLAFMRGMAELGYVDGKNVVVEKRAVDGQLRNFAVRAAELVKLKVDVIVTAGSEATRAAQKATASIPIVMVGVGDPIGAGFVKSLARPGGNITGLSSLTPELSHKHIELLLAAGSKTTRVAMLVDPVNTVHASILKSASAAAPLAGVRIVPTEAGTSAELAQAITRASLQNADALIVNGALFNGYLREIAGLCVKYKLASISAFRAFPESGGLMSYGQNLQDSHRRMAAYVDRIIKGARPENIPVEQPSKFELVVNLKTAKALGITIPQSVLLQADRVIE